MTETGGTGPSGAETDPSGGGPKLSGSGAGEPPLSDAERGPAGKRLGFLVQEMHREANTIASKANDTEIAHASVTIREEIERLREQLENIE